MKKTIVFLTALAMLVSAFAFVPAVGGTDTAYAASGLIAFPGAEGGGMYTTGARASSSPTIYHVTSLDDSGTGTLRDAVSKSNRIVVFDVAGTISLTKQLTLSKENITILGQTSPGDGICISGAPTVISADNIIMRYLRFRMGVYDEANMKYDGDALGGTSSTSNLIVDHCSMSWSTDECCSFYAIKDSTIQWCIMTEPLNRSIHDEGDGIQQHGYGGIWGGVNVSYHHNIVSSANNRFPRVGTSETVRSYNDTADTESLLDVRNNVFYNWKSNNSYGGENGVRVNFVNNYYKEGPASSSINRFYQMMSGDDGGKSKWGTDIAISGNYYDSKSGESKVSDINSDNTKGVDSKDAKVYNIETYDGSLPGTTTNHTQYIHDYPIGTHTAQKAYTLVLESAGDSISRDAVDIRAVEDIENRTGKLGTNGILDLSDLKELPTITYSGTKPTDTDGDGMSDTYEDTNGLDKNDSSDALKKASSGYYNIEEYANSLITASETGPIETVDPNAPTPTPTAVPTPSPTPTPTPAPKYDITADENMQNGTIEINGASTKSVSWEAYDHKTDISGAKTLPLSGTDDTDGTITMYDTTTTLFEYAGDGEFSARGNTNPGVNGNTGVKNLPFSSSNTPYGSIFNLAPANDGEASIEVYLYSGKKFSLYDNTSESYIMQQIDSGSEGHRTYTFDVTAGHEYYFWADGSKVGLKNATVSGGGIDAREGETITITTVPIDGYRADSVYTTPQTEVTKISENEYSFVMPAQAVTVGAVFSDANSPTPEPTATPVPTATPNVTPTPTIVPTATPAATATPDVTATPTTPEVTSTPETTETPAVTPDTTAVPDVTATPVVTPNAEIYYSSAPEFDGADVKFTLSGTIFDKGEKVLAIAAAYDGDDLLAEVKTAEITAADESTKLTFSQEYADVRVYVWEYGTLRPLLDTVKR